MAKFQRPPFLSVVIHDLVSTPHLTGLCAGYEQGKWRVDALADHLLEALPEFCLTYSEASELDHETAVALLRQAARRVYTTQKFLKRGEFGELLLHAVLRQTVKSLPAISKIFYKDAENDTVKGFDAVHVVPANGRLELWLGEVKFYKDVGRAINDVVAELHGHTEAKYLRGEFYAIRNKIDDAWPYASQLKSLLNERTSLDKVFDALCIPVLLTYDGAVTSRHAAYCQTYIDELSLEMNAIRDRFVSKGLPAVRIHLFLLPTATKNDLLAKLDAKLKTWQQI